MSRLNYFTTNRQDRFFAFAYSDVDVATAYAELHEDISRQGANCFGVTPSPFVDYGDEGEDEPFVTPTAVEAVTMCSGCPVVEGCFLYAKLYKPKHGVWGGVLWRNGRGKGIPR